MKVDTILAAGDWTSLPDEARRLQAAGYDGAWTAEVSHDPFLPLAVAAGATSRMSLGTSIAVAFARSPMTTAYIANDLQAASRGRFILGLGSQIKAHVTRRFSMPWAGRPRRCASTSARCGRSGRRGTRAARLTCTASTTGTR